MKILHVCDWYRPFGGAEKLLFGMLDLLEGAGHENYIIANDVPTQIRTNQRPEYFLENLEMDFGALPRRRIFLKNVKTLQENLESVIQKHDPDVIHIHSLQNSFALQVLTKKYPSVRSIHDPRLYCFTNWRLLPNKEVCPYPLGRACLTKGCLSWNFLNLSKTAKEAPFRIRHLRENRKVDILIAESHAVFDCLSQNGFPRDRIEILPNLTEKKGPFEDVMAFNKLYHNPKERTVVFVGRASYEKGIDYLLGAMALVPKPWKLILVTGGEYLSSVRERIKSLGIEDSVEMPGVLDYEATRTYYARADIVVVPSIWIESFCLVGLEAMANGKPVVAFNIGGIPDWLEDGKTGFLAEKRNVGDLADKIRILFDDSKLAESMGRNGYERASTVFSKERYLTGLEDIYKKAIDKHGVDK